MEYSHNEVKAGVMIIAALILGFVVLIMIGNWEAWFGRFNTIEATFSNVSGLARDAELQYHGVKVGWIREVEVENPAGSQPGHVKVTGWISADIRLADRDYAIIEKLITGKVVVNIVSDPEKSAGTTWDDKTKTWHVRTKDIPSFTDIQDEAAHFIAELREFLKENRANVQETTKRLANASAALDELIRKNEKNVNETIKAIGEASEQVRKALADNQGRLSKTFDKIIETLNDASQIMHQNRLGIRRTVNDIAEAAANVRAATQDLRNNPWKIYYRPRPKDVAYQNLYSSMEATYASLREVRQASAALEAAAKVDKNLATATEAARAELDQALKRLENEQRKIWGEMKKNAEAKP